ncbi:hypothetical protein [Pseudoalteromonas sp. SG43-4]|uniref:hypothetical protein n=1 Tax=Pseudoalteromonas sp. SG43-4 TaxID=2760969 RepID=UPI0016022D69|nr:hypothetical protein [Pseudoalteromonas sp. SG43-4]MBB1428912.1 hypothetical protein [Pseudoalteromonas sp. SG43-4]
MNIDLNAMSQVATISSSITALIAVFFIIFQIKSSNKNNKMVTAHTTYNGYLKLCFDNPYYAKGINEKSDNVDVRYEQYKWFVSSMLFSFEEILAVYPNDKRWFFALESQLERHRNFLKNSSSVKRGEWSKPLTSLLEKITR